MNTTKATSRLPGSGNSASIEVGISNMTCAACVARVEKAVRNVEGVTRVDVNLVNQNAKIEGGDPEAILDAINNQGYVAVLTASTEQPGSEIFLLLSRFFKTSPIRSILPQS